MTKYVKLIDESTIEEAPINNKERGILNYNLDVDLMLEDGYLLLNENELPTSEKIVPYYVQEEDEVVRHYKEIQPVEKTDEELASEIRNQRNAMLKDTDWTVLPDSPLNESQKQVYIEYRQALRDITAQEGFPRNVDWPVLDL